MASAQVVKTSVNTNNSPSQDYTTNPDNHSHHNINETINKHRSFYLIFSYKFYSCILFSQISILLNILN